MNLLDLIRQYCKDNSISVRKLADLTGITARQAQHFLAGNNEPSWTTGKAIESWYWHEIYAKAAKK